MIKSYLRDLIFLDLILEIENLDLTLILELEDCLGVLKIFEREGGVVDEVAAERERGRKSEEKS